jgi:hypothetical protein
LRLKGIGDCGAIWSRLDIKERMLDFGFSSHDIASARFLSLAISNYPNLAIVFLARRPSYQLSFK